MTAASTCTHACPAGNIEANIRYEPKQVNQAWKHNVILRYWPKGDKRKKSSNTIGPNDIGFIAEGNKEQFLRTSSRCFEAPGRVGWWRTHVFLGSGWATSMQQAKHRYAHVHNRSVVGTE
jgi:hypothetical protein